MTCMQQMEKSDFQMTELEHLSAAYRDNVAKKKREINTNQVIAHQVDFLTNF